MSVRTGLSHGSVHVSPLLLSAQTQKDKPLQKDNLCLVSSAFLKAQLSRNNESTDGKVIGSYFDK